VPRHEAGFRRENARVTSIPHAPATRFADTVRAAPMPLPAAPADRSVAPLDAHRSLTLSRRLLRFLLVARLAMVLCGLAMTAILTYRAGAAFPLLEVFEVLLGVALVTWLAWHRLVRRSVIFEDDYLLQLVGDIVLLTYALILSGGHDNPFSHYFLVPLVLAAYSLSWRRVVIVILVGAVGWGAIHLTHTKMPPFEHWVDVFAHLLLATLVTYFAHAMASISRRHERSVARQREDALERRNTRALQTVAAQAAHGISTPLATMAVLLRELRNEDMSAGDHREVVETLTRQVQACKDSLSDLIASVGDARGDEAGSMGVDAFVRAACDECQLMDPIVAVGLEFDGSHPAPEIVVERSLVEGLVLAIEECASSPPHAVGVRTNWDASRLTVTITGGGGWADSQVHYDMGERRRRRGPAPGQESLSLAAKLFERFGGRMTYRPAVPGKWLQITLPLNDLRRMQ